jgi:formate-dependent nitrite reductase cytochrome c552 subunit
MSAIFPKWTSRLPAILIVGGFLTATSVVGGLWYYFTPKYTRVGYQPVQPVSFPHSVHVDQLGLDCRYCHTDVEKSWYSNVPAATTCMNCHNQVLKDDSRLALVRESAASGKPIPWVQVHKVPDYVYFNHSVHIARGVSCISCHGEIHKMDEVKHAKPLSMTFCLDCHRNPEQNIRPTDKVTQLDWVFDSDPHAALEKQKKFGDAAVKDWKVNASQNCSACHR